MDWAETPFLTSGNEKGRRFFGLSKPTKRRPNICDSFSAMMPLFSREKSSLKGRWRLETGQDMRSSSSNPVSCSETSIKIYGSKEEIRARKSPETVDAPGFTPDASIPVILYGMPDWIRTSGLWSRSYQAVKPETAAAQWFDHDCTNFRHFEEKPRTPCSTRLPRFFAVVVK